MEPTSEGIMFDIHTHSYCSDGMDAPEEVVRLAAETGLSLFALTDHDTLLGVPAALKAAAELGLPFLTGCEIEAQYADTLHILGLGVDLESPELAALMRKKLALREERNRKLSARLAELGMDCSSALVESAGATTKANYASALVKLGFAKDLSDAFGRILGRGCPAYIAQQHPSPEEVVGAIRAAGGAAVIAHPMKMKRCDPVSLIRDMARIGIEGVEAHYCGATEGETRLFSSLARENELFITCGSDYHGARRPTSPIGGAWRDCEDLRLTEAMLLNRFF